MYVNYKNVLKKEKLIKPEILKEYERIKTCCQNCYQYRWNVQQKSTAKSRWKQAKEIIKNEEYYFQRIPVSLDSINKKWLLLTGMTFPDEQNFLNTLQLYGITKQNCIDFSNDIDQMDFELQKDPNDSIEWSMIEFLDMLKLKQILIHYGIGSYEVVINKILEIAYLNPELLHNKKNLK